MRIFKQLLNGVKRNSNDIERDFLEYLILKPEGAKLTELMYKVNMSHSQLKGYIKEMIDRGFIYEIIPEGIGSSYHGYKIRRFRILKPGIEYYIRLRLLEYNNNKGV